MGAFCYFWGVKHLLSVLVGLGCAITLVAAAEEWLSVFPAEQKDAIGRRLDAYVKANQARDWNKLYDLVSDAGRAGVNRQTFVAKMKMAHGKGFSNSPDLLGFRPSRGTKTDEADYDIYGCGKAQREGQDFNGVALTHVVFEHNNWFFSGWTFTQFPNEPCTALSDASWEAPGAMEWNQPLLELRQSGGPSFHVDTPKK